MARLGPFEARPQLAIGVSGGPDSMALCWLLTEWVKGLNGKLLALIVDHALRPKAAAEAGQTARWLTEHGIASKILRWDRPPSDCVVAHETSRAARHQLLAKTCEAEGILHLCLAHHQDDQAETLLLRLAKGSGMDGLAGMAAIRERCSHRILRPLLDQPRERLLATCRAAGVPFVTDPSNDSPAYARGRLRAVAPLLVAEGLDAARLADTARRCGEDRALLDELTAAWAGRTVTLWPEGYLDLDSAVLQEAPPAIALRVLGRCLRIIGGKSYAPRRIELQRLLNGLTMPAGPRGHTLGGCLLRRHGRCIMISREAVLMASPQPLNADGETWWDGRFCLRWPESAHDKPKNILGMTIGALGKTGRVALRSLIGLQCLPIPALVQETLPALRDKTGLVAVPFLGFWRDSALKNTLKLHFMPADSLSGPAFAVV